MNDREQAIIDAYKSGMEIDLIQHIYGISRQWIYRILKKNSIPTNRVRRIDKLDDIDVGEAIERYDFGDTIQNIATALRLSQDQVVRLLQMNGKRVSRSRRAWKIPSYKLLKPLARLIVDHGMKVSYKSDAFKENVPYSHMAYTTRFGSWTKAKQSAVRWLKNGY